VVDPLTAAAGITLDVALVLNVVRALARTRQFVVVREKARVVDVRVSERRMRTVPVFWITRSRPAKTSGILPVLVSSWSGGLVLHASQARW
jgi:hypothetical protein